MDISLSAPLSPKLKKEKKNDNQITSHLRHELCIFYTCDHTMCEEKCIIP